MAEKSWKTYEEVAAHLLDQFASHFGVDRFEGKQSMPGSSGTDWEIDAKGCSEDGTMFLVVECKRHTKQGVTQAIAGSLAFTIQDVGATGGILVTPVGLQAGAKRVAASSNVIEVVLDKDSTTTDYVLKFLNQLCIGMSERLTITDSLSITVIDKHGNIVDRREA